MLNICNKGLKLRVPQNHLQFWGARWLSGRVSDSGAEVRGSRPTAAVLCPWARHFTPRKYWLITQEAMAPSRHDWKIVDWDVKPQHNQPTYNFEVLMHSEFCISSASTSWTFTIIMWFITPPCSLSISCAVSLTVFIYRFLARQGELLQSPLVIRVRVRVTLL